MTPTTMMTMMTITLYEIGIFHFCIWPIKVEMIIFFPCLLHLFLLYLLGRTIAMAISQGQQGVYLVPPFFIQMTLVTFIMLFICTY
jgi:hypothetical protein